MLRGVAGALVLIATLPARSGAAPASSVRAAQQRHRFLHLAALRTPIQHVIVIVQENRSVDNLFNGFPGADTVRVDPVTGSQLQPCSLHEAGTGCPSGSHKNTRCDPSHAHEPNASGVPEGFSVEYDGGKMDGFVDENGKVCTLVNNEDIAYSYVPRSEVAQYWGFAAANAFVNHALQSNNSPSFPAHQYLIAGQAGGLRSDGTIDPSNPWSIDENNTVPAHHPRGPYYSSCLTPGAFATAVDLLTSFPGLESTSMIHPCNGYATIFDEMQSAGLGWRYYTNGEGGIWGGPSAVSQDCMGVNAATGLCNNPAIVDCSPRALVDFMRSSSALPNLTYVIPDARWSDHPVSVTPNARTGPNWVTWLVNSIGKSRYWSTTTIIVTWDDWGGWYDHYQPGGAAPNQSIINCATNGSVVTPASCGFRVPIIVIGPYVKRGYVDATPTNAFGSILLYIEHTFGLSTLTPRGSGALGTADDWTTDDLMNTMDFSAGVRSFSPQPTSTPASYYTSQPCFDASGGEE